VEEMDIVLNEGEVLPSSQPPRRYSEVVKKFIREEVSKWLEAGIISPSNSSFVSQAVVVKASGKDWRLCIDFQGLNAVTKANRFPLPNIKDMLRRVAGKKFYAKLDHKKGYLQLGVKMSSRRLTAFICDLGVFEFNRIPFGLRNAPAFFQYVISKEVLAGLLYTCCEVYIDDVIIFADTLEELEVRFRSVLKRFQDFGIIINPEKCVYGVEEIEFLGHVISKDGIALGKKKVEALKRLEAPKDKSSLKSLLGLTNYFRDFIPFYADKVAILERLVVKDVKFEWTTAQENAFSAIKEEISSAGMLFALNYELPIYVRTDASKNGVGAVMYQIHEGTVRNISFISKRFSKAATRWSTLDQESFA
jgi:hypothetical protein